MSSLVRAKSKSATLTTKKQKSNPTTLDNNTSPPTDIVTPEASAPSLQDISVVNDPIDTLKAENDYLKNVIEKLLTQNMESASAGESYIYRIDDENGAKAVLEGNSHLECPPSIVEMLRGQIKSSSATRIPTSQEVTRPANFSSLSDQPDSTTISSPIVSDYFSHHPEPISHVASISESISDAGRANVVVTSLTNNLGEREAIVIDVNREDFWVLVNEDEAYAVDPALVPASATPSTPATLEEVDTEYVVVDKHELEQQLSKYVMEILMHDPAVRGLDPQQIRAALTGNANREQASFFSRLFSSSTSESTEVASTQHNSQSRAVMLNRLKSTYTWGNMLYSAWGWASLSFALYRNPRMSRIVLTYAYKAIKYAIVLIV